MSEDNKLPIIDFRDKRAVLRASTVASGKQSTTTKSIEKEYAKQGIVEFTDEEIKTMPKQIRRLIIIQKKRCRIRTHVSGKDTFTYEIRFRRDGYDVSASGKTIELAKENFLVKLKSAKQKTSNLDRMIIPQTFHSFAMYYFETFRKEKVAAQTYKHDMHRYNKYLQPHFGEKQIKKITPSDCKMLLDEVKNQGKGKTADELHSLMNGIYNCAITHRVIDFNPLVMVLHIQHEREEGEALTPEAEEKLIAWLPSSDCAVEIALCLFAGLRANEMENKENPPIIENGFIKAVNSKRHFKDKTKIEYKYIPICNRLAPFLKNGIDIKNSAKTARRRLKLILPNNTLKDLRTTFYTRCQTFNVEENALKSFMGHSFGKLGNAYSDLSKQREYLLKEGEKLNKW